MYRNEDPWPVAIVSIFLYTALAATSLYYFLKFRAIKLNAVSQADVGKYDDPKIAFFLLLFISAVLDIPSYIGCLGISDVHHPRDCEYTAPSYRIFWSMHLMALWGYAFAIVTPPVMWSDIINKNDGRLFFSKTPLDNTKRFFICMLSFYLLTLLVIVICALLFMNEDVDAEDFQSNNVYYGISLVLEVGITVLICIGCLICGVRLQLHVKSVKLHYEQEVKFLVRLNVTLVIVLATYVTKSFYILRLFPTMPKAYQDQLACSYFTWVLVTRWLPYILCSFCLIHEMRLSSAEIAARKHGQDKMDDVRSPLSDNEERPSFLIDDSQISKLLSISSKPQSIAKKSKDSSSLSRSLLASDEMSPSSRYFEDSYNGGRGSDASSMSGGHIDNFALHDASGSFPRTYSTQGGNSFKASSPI